MVVETAMGTGRKTRKTTVAAVAAVVATESRPEDA
jgi:hypothetical protein